MVTEQSRKWWTVAAMALPLLLLEIDFFGMMVAMPTIGRELQVSTTDLQCLVNAFQLAFAAPLAAIGRLGDVLGRRRVLLLGVGLFGVSSALAGLAQAQ
jgi:MFS family permease